MLAAGIAGRVLGVWYPLDFTQDGDVVRRRTIQGQAVKFLCNGEVYDLAINTTATTVGRQQPLRIPLPACSSRKPAGLYNHTQLNNPTTASRKADFN